MSEQRATTLFEENSAATASWSTALTTPSWARSRPRAPEREVCTTFLISERKTKTIRADPGRRSGASSLTPRPRRPCVTCLPPQPAVHSLTTVKWPITTSSLRNRCNNSNNNNSNSSSTHPHHLVSLRAGPLSSFLSFCSFFLFFFSSFCVEVRKTIRT